MSEQTKMADVLIIGGGLVGGPLACLLAANGLEVVVVERERADISLAPEFDGRASALALSAQRVLSSAELWSDIEPFAAPIRQIRVSDDASPLFLHYNHEMVGENEFGWIVENRAMRSAVLRRFTKLSSLTLLSGLFVTNLARDASQVRAVLSDGSLVEAQLAVAADGRASPTRASAGIGITNWKYNQTAIVCTVAHSLSHQDTAQELFLPSGPFAILPLNNNRSSVVWTEKSSVAASIMAQDDQSFHRELVERFAGHLGELRLEGPRFAYPLSLQFADRYHAERLALVGDAAHGMHPVAGQGMNMGLRDTAALAEILVDAHRLGIDLGTEHLLERYGRWRRFDNLLMLGLTDGIVRLFSNNFAPLQIIRRAGLAAVERAPFLKRFFIRHAMGVVGALPKVMRGEAL